MTAVLEIDRLSKEFQVGGGWFGLAPRRVLKAVDNVSFAIAPNRTLALVGESGCGKTTIGRMILRLIDPSAGAIRLRGADISQLQGEALRQMRRNVQIVFQDPFASLNARMRADDIVGEPLRNFAIGDAASRARRVAELFDQVGLPRRMLERYPHELSGGQRQRIGIARALALGPDLIVADEAVAALDVSIRAQILNLLKRVQADLGIASLFISHDLAVVRYLAHDVAVMYLGAIVEMAPADRLIRAPLHPYTRALIDAVPAPRPRDRRRRALLTGEVPSATAIPSGCRFRTRCPMATEICASAQPPLREVADAHRVACHHAAPDHAGAPAAA